MRVTHVGHACILVETDGIGILSDPWWKGPCFGAQWWVHPKPFVEAADPTRIDYIYISHGHHDHLHSGTLRTLPKTAKVLVSAELGIAPQIRELGFEVIEFDADGEIAIGASGKVRCRIVRTHGDDSLLAIDDGERICLNLNDALHSAPHEVQDRHAAQLKRWYPRIDHVFCGYGTASHFPNCYVIPGKDDGATAQRRQRYFNREWARVVHALNPVFAFPFAADVVLLEDPLFWTNAPVHNGERPGEALLAEYPGTKIRTIDIAPGFVIDGDVVVSHVVRTPIDEDALRIEYADGIRRANLATAANSDVFDGVAATLTERVARLQRALASFPVDYRMLIRFHNSERHLALVKQRGRVDLVIVDDAEAQDDGSDRLHGEAHDEAHASAPGFDLVYRTRLAYLKWALVEPVGDEILFVGSGGVFAYRSRALVALNAHRELIGLFRDDVRERVVPSAARRVVGAVKRVISRALGRTHVDLYDLNQWTVYRA